MSRLYASKQIIQVLKKNGFTQISQKGSHVKFRKEDKIVIVPHPKGEIPMGTFYSILRQCGLARDDFKE
jgi:predicted RNA binding protein YcfA (HicA-like mRNA interferase family)